MPSSSSCCMSREAPSPDGDAPRPVHSPQKSPKSPKSPKKLAKPNPSPSVGSVLSKLEDAAQLHAIFEDKSDTEDGQDRLNGKKSSSTLSAIKTKLKKHMSQDLALVKRHSRSSVGTSEEEIQRRAELRRLRDKRIREELSNEGLYDDDARSFSTLPAPVPSPGEQTPPSWVSDSIDAAQTSEKGHVTEKQVQHLDQMSPVELPPLRQIPQLQIESDHDDSNKATANLGPNSQGQLYSPIHPDRGRVSPIQGLDVARRGSSVPPLPPTPTLPPQRLPSIAEPAMRSSWRLSFTAENRADHLRRLSQGSAISPTGSPIQVLVGQPPINKWLRSQGLRSSSQAITSSEDVTNAESLVDPEATLLADFGGVDGSEEAPRSVHLHEMGISQCLGSKGLHSSSSSPQLSSWGSRSHHRGVSSVSGGSKFTLNKHTKRLQSTSESITLSELIPPSWGKLLQDTTSSVYSSAGDSIQPSPESSHFNLTSLLSGGKRVIELANSKNSGSPIVQPNNGDQLKPDLSAEHPLTSMRLLDHSTAASNAYSISDTQSVRRWELELTSNVSRLPSTASNPKPNTPVSSKFREEFDSEPTPTQNIKSKPEAKVSSPFIRLAKFVSKSYDGSSVDDMFTEPSQRRGFGYKFAAPSNSQQRVDGTPRTDNQESTVDWVKTPVDDATAAWQRAVKMQWEERANKVAMEMKLPKKKSRGTVKGFRSLSWKMRGKKKVSDASDSMDPKDRGDGEDEPGKLDNSDAENGVSVQHHTTANELRTIEDGTIAELDEEEWKARSTDRVMDAWALTPTPREVAEDKTTEPGSSSPRGRTLTRGTRVANSWARYPSHTRNERAESAGRKDNIITRDFAIKTAGTDSGEVEWHQADRPHIHHHHGDKQHHHVLAQSPDTSRSLPTRWGNQMRRSLYKLHSSASQAMSSNFAGRRSSVSVSGKLEFPELELLPAEVLETLQLQVDVGKQMRNEENHRRRSLAGTGALDGSVGDPAEEDNVQLDAFTHPGGSEREGLEQSFADPSFYDDCITVPFTEDKAGGDEDEADDLMPERSPTVIKKEKFKTWHGRDWDGYRYGEKSRHISVGTVALRKSTDDFGFELERLEKLEKERAIRSAEDAWALV